MNEQIIFPCSTCGSPWHAKQAHRYYPFTGQEAIPMQYRASTLPILHDHEAVDCDLPEGDDDVEDGFKFTCKCGRTWTYIKGLDSWAFVKKAAKAEDR